MPQNRPYLYDPSQQIRKDLGSAADSVAQGFQNVLDKKKQEYDFIEKIRQDAELIKKDLNYHNAELMTKRSNELLQETANAIKDKGKIDFTKLGELKRKVVEIGDAKRNSELSIQAFGEVAKMTQANAAYMRNPVETISKMMAKLKDEKLLFSPRNMYEMAMEDYKDGLDYTKIIGDKLNELVKRGTPVQGLYDAKDGSQIEYKGVVPFKFRMNPDTKQLEPKVEVDPKTGQVNDPLNEIVSSVDPELWKGYMKQIVRFGQMFNPDYTDHAKDFINSTLGGSVSYSVKEDALKRNTARINANLKEVQLGNELYKASPEQRKIENEKDLLDLNYKRASISNMSQDNSLSQQRLAQDKKEFDYKKEQDAKGKINSSGNFGGKRLNAGGNSYYTELKYGTKDIKGVGSSTKGGIELIPKLGGKNIHLDTNDKIEEFRANSTEADRKLIDEMMSSPKYVPAKGQSKTSAPSKVDVSNLFPTPKK